MGEVFGSSGLADKAVTIEELVRHVANHSSAMIGIEEQHWCEYLIRADESRGKVWVTTASPAFPRIRSLHHHYYAKALTGRFGGSE